MSAEDRVDAFRGLAHPARRRVLRLLAQGDRSVSELHAALDLSLPGLSQHLLVLRETGWVTHHAQGPRRYYKLNRKILPAVRRWLTSLNQT